MKNADDDRDFTADRLAVIQALKGPDLEVENAALRKRVAELERDNLRLKNAEAVHRHTEEFTRTLSGELDEVKSARARLIGVNKQLCKEMSELQEHIVYLESQLQSTLRKMAELEVAP